MATSEQIARLAGVSRATVSRTLNGSSQVSEKTKERIFKIMAELENDKGDGQVILSSPLIALALFDDEQGLNFSCLPASSHYFYLSILKDIDQLVAKANYDLFLPSGRHGNENVTAAQARYIQTLQAHNVVGVIAVSMSSNDPRVQALYQISIPTVFLDSMFHGDYATWVRSDYMDGSRQAVEYLLSLGHRRIAFFHGEGAKDIERLLGWHQALAKVGLTPDPQLIRLSTWHMESAYQAAMELLEERRDFTAIIAGSDMMAFGILRALHTHGLNVPEDVSLIGFDDINYSEISNPPLTTIRQDTRKLSQEAVSRLLHMIETGETPGPMIVPTQLIIRGSASSILHSAEWR